MRPHRLFVCGGSRLSAQTADLWRALGHRLGRESGLVVITGGLAGRKDSPGESADRAFVEAYVASLRKNNDSAERRLLTYLPTIDWDRLRRFREGKIVEVRHATPQARRFRMVHAADLIVAIEGGRGTRSILDMAIGIERPVLPVPVAGGACLDVWNDLREQIRDWFDITSEETERLERQDVSSEGLAELIWSVLERGLRHKCFVVMPFHDSHAPVYDQAIAPALRAHGLEAWRTDRTVVHGNIVTAIRDGLRHCHL